MFLALPELSYPTTRHPSIPFVTSFNQLRAQTPISVTSQPSRKDQHISWNYCMKRFLFLRRKRGANLR